MKKLIASLGLLVAAGAHAAGAGIHLDEWPAERTRDLAALQNGARLFVNYCMGCHGAALVRWNRLADIGLQDRQIKEFLIFGNQKVGDPMAIAMGGADARQWFGKVPPDLSVIVRARTSFEYKGADYLYTLLRGYYRDASSPTGWNNTVYPNIGMPHILWQRQGPREVTIDRVAHEVDEKTGKESFFQEVTVFDSAGQAKSTRTPLAGHPAAGVSATFKPLDAAAARRYDGEVADLVAFLNFITEPGADTRVRIGVWVMLFLLVFTVAAWWLNKAYWKDVK